MPLAVNTIVNKFLHRNGETTGTVTFKDDSTTLAVVTVSGNKAALTTSTLTAGTHSITVIYSGDSNFIGSTSKVLSQVVK